MGVGEGGLDDYFSQTQRVKSIRSTTTINAIGIDKFYVVLGKYVLRGQAILRNPNGLFDETNRLFVILPRFG